MGKKRRRRFSREFKLEAVKLVKESGVAVAQAARDLDVYETSLRRWIRQYEIDHGEGPEGALSSAEKEELRRLRREVRTLKMEREILKKATAFFAKEGE
jgi:transposase-like protein